MKVRGVLLLSPRVTYKMQCSSQRFWVKRCLLWTTSVPSTIPRASQKKCLVLLSGSHFLWWMPSFLLQRWRPSSSERLINFTQDHTANRCQDLKSDPDLLTSSFIFSHLPAGPKWLRMTIVPPGIEGRLVYPTCCLVICFPGIISCVAYHLYWFLFLSKHSVSIFWEVRSQCYKTFKDEPSRGPPCLVSSCSRLIPCNLV